MHPTNFFIYMMNQITTIPSAMGFLSLFLLLLLILVGSSALIMLAHVITDAFSIEHLFDPMRAYHLIFIFPIMLMFLLIRFGIQRRDQMEFYCFEFTNWEAKIVRSMGYTFKEDYTTVEYQNAFGARWEGADCTTTVFRVPPIEKKRDDYGMANSLKYLYK